MRMLFFVHPGDHTRLVLRDFVRGFEQCGHHVSLMELAPLWNTYGPQPGQRPLAEASTALLKVIKEQQIEATGAMEGLGLRSFAHASNKGRPQTVFDVAKTPHLMFWHEAPHWADGGRYAQNFGQPMLATKACVHLVDNAPAARELRERLGFGQVLAHPWAVDPEVFAPQTGIAEEFDVVVSCGKGNPQPTPEALWHLDSDSPDLNVVRRGMVGHLAPFVDQFAKQSPKPVEVRAFLMALLETQVSSRHVPLLNRMEEVAARDFKLQQAMQVLSAAPGAFIQTGRIVRNVEIFERAFLISWLSRRFNMLLVGDHDLAPWGVKAYQIPAVHSSHLPATLARARVVLGLSRWQDDAGLGTRPFEIGACGVACVMQRRPGLEKLFEPGNEFAYFDTPVEAATAIRSLLDDPERRRTMGQNARARVLRDHTWKHRAEVITPSLEAARERLK